MNYAEERDRRAVQFSDDLLLAFLLACYVFQAAFSLQQQHLVKRLF